MRGGLKGEELVYNLDKTGNMWVQHIQREQIPAWLLTEEDAEAQCTRSLLVPHFSPLSEAGLPEARADPSLCIPRVTLPGLVPGVDLAGAW